MDQHHPSRPRALKRHTDGADTGGTAPPAAGWTPAVVARRGASYPAPVVSRRPALRELRHPNVVSAPPLVRGSMPQRPWRGFWRSLGAHALAAANRLLSPRGGRAGGAAPARAPWQAAAARRRAVFALVTVLSTSIATWLFASAQPAMDNQWLHAAQIALFALLSTWVVTGFVTALMGFWVMLRGDAHSISAAAVRERPLAQDTRTAIVMPICNEDVASVFAGLQATCESVAATGHARQFDVFVLSDTADDTTAAAERAAWERLRAALAAGGSQPPVEVYYRRRQRRTHRKAGNVADFCRRWGRDYDHMVVLDADSVMSGECIVTLAKLMQAHPQAGIIQTATQAVGHDTLHARAQQFASRVTGRLFTLGMQFWQLGESHYWGHNAIIRIAPFMAHCGLAPIRGNGGLSGGILSHDFVEAALMRRAGWQVWLVSDLAGSYEQQPPDLLSELQRDRRWCQGNMQNARLIAEPGIHRVHRMMFGVGAMSYIAAPLWLVFLSLGAALWLAGAPLDADWQAVPRALAGLWIWTLTLLLLPRVLAVAAVFMRREQGAFGGGAALVAGAVLETLLAMLQAPVRMLAHAVFVGAALTGARLGWTSPPRSATGLGWRDAAARLAPMLAPVALAAMLAAALRPGALLLLSPVLLPLALAVPLAVLTSHLPLGRAARARGLLLIPEEARSPAVLRRAWQHALAGARRLQPA